MELLGKTILFYLVFFSLSWLVGRWFDPPPVKDDATKEE